MFSIRKRIEDGYIETVVGAGIGLWARENKNRGGCSVLEWLASAFSDYSWNSKMIMFIARNVMVGFQ